MARGLSKNQDAKVQDRIAGILRRVTEETRAENYLGALRWADRADRLAPGDDAINEIIGRLYVKLGEPQKALQRLNAVLKRRPDPALHAEVVNVLFDLGRMRLGFALLETGLNRFAVGQGEALALAARRHTIGSDTRAPGWVGVTSDLKIIGEIRPGLKGEVRLYGAALEPEVQNLQPLEDDGVSGWRFQAAPPEGYEGELNAAAGGAVLIGSDTRFPPDFRADGRAAINDGKLIGWASLGWAPALEPTVVVEAETGEVARLLCSKEIGRSRRRTFSFDLQSHGLTAGRVKVSVALPTGRLSVLADSPLLVSLPEPPEGAARGPLDALAFAKEKPRAVDVIIPVYGGRAETMACLQSVRANLGDRADIIVIDDASPETEIQAALDGLAAEGAITLLRNPENVGFAASVNRGLAVHPSRDAIILNSDAEVFPGWIERLRQAAYSAPDIATVTPLTNSGTIASYPREEGSPCTSDGAARIAAVAGEVNDKVAVETPTGVGFCLYIRRVGWEDVGPFDHACFGRGYGEENDFCLRARALGWRHLIAADVYVRHLGGQSFGPAREAMMERNAQLLSRRHPNYDGLVEAFIEKDPLRPARRALDEQRLKDTIAAHVLFVTLAPSGGVDRFVEERREKLRREGRPSLVLHPGEDGLLKLKSDNETLTSLLYGSEEIGALFSTLNAVALERIEIHHFYGLPATVMDRVKGLPVPKDFYVHDYGLVCPRITFLGGEGRYCGEPPLEACAVCLQENGSLLEEGLSAGALRERSAGWLSAMGRVVAPSKDVRSRMERYFPGVPFEVEPWEAFEVPPTREPAPGPSTDGRLVRVGVIGAIAAVKGYEVLKACAEDAHERGLPLRFVVLGHTMDDDALSATPNVFITGYYQEHELEGLILREGVEIAFLPSVVPETWSFTLSAALKARLPVAAFDLGAIAERVRRSGARHSLLALETAPSAINDALLGLSVRNFVNPDAAKLDNIQAFKTDEALPVPVFKPRKTSGSKALEFEGGPGKTMPVPRSPELDGPESRHGTEVVPQRPPAPQSQVRPRVRDVMQPIASNPQASVQILVLKTGLYRFAVTAAGDDQGRRSSTGLPAIQISAGPGAKAGSVDYMSGPNTEGAWLLKANDTVVARIKVDETPVFITSYSMEGLPALHIEVEKIDAVRARKDAPALERAKRPAIGGPKPPENEPVGVTGSSARLSADGRKVVPTRVVAHISRRGDVAFVDQPLVGDPAKKLRIEGFLIQPLADLNAQDLEYKTLSEKGVESAWTAAGVFCGTKGMNLSLAGFSIRLKGEGARRFDCRYSGHFASGKIVGPMANGAPLFSGELDDHLVGLSVEILASPSEVRSDGGAGRRDEWSSDARSGGQIRPDERPFRPLRWTPEPAAEAEPAPVRATGPRFSIFRDEDG